MGVLKFLFYAVILLVGGVVLITCSTVQQFSDKDAQNRHNQHNQRSMDRLDEMARKSAKEKYGDNWCHYDSDWEGEC